MSTTAWLRPNVRVVPQNQHESALLVNEQTFWAERANTTGYLILRLALEREWPDVVRLFADAAQCSEELAAPVIEKYLDRLTSAGWIQVADRIG